RASVRACCRSTYDCNDGSFGWACLRDKPHSGQNLAWDGLSCWHPGHFMPGLRQSGRCEGRNGAASLGEPTRAVKDGNDPRAGRRTEHENLRRRSTNQFLGEVWVNERSERLLRPLTPRCRWLRGLDLNQRPLGYEPNELPGCSTPR